MNGMKYIMFNGRDFLIFPPSVSHLEAAGRFTDKVTSAGFIALCTDGSEIRADCYGKSVSLGIISWPEEDSRVITRSLRAYA